MSEILGTLAAVLTAASFLPQAIKVLRTRDTHGISLTMYVLFTFGVAGWLAYGLIIASPPVIISNAIIFVLAAAILILKLLETKEEYQEISDVD